MNGIQVVLNAFKEVFGTVCFTTAAIVVKIVTMGCALFCLCRYSKMNFTKNPEKYLKHTPETLEDTLRSVFDGGAQ